MTAAFRQYAAAAAEVLDNVFGETIEVHPMVTGEFSVGSEDPDTPVFRLTGIATTPDKVLRVESREAVHGERSDILFNTAHIDIQAALLKSRPPIKKGWRLVLPDRDPPEVYEVSSPPESDGITRIRFAMVKVTSA